MADTQPPPMDKTPPAPIVNMEQAAEFVNDLRAQIGTTVVTIYAVLQKRP